MSANQSILDDLILHISPDKFYVESLTFTESVLVIDRISYEISLQASNGQIPNMASRKPIAGIMGIISLMSGPYLVVITKKARLGALQVISSLCYVAQLRFERQPSVLKLFLDMWGGEQIHNRKKTPQAYVSL